MTVTSLTVLEPVRVRGLSDDENSVLGELLGQLRARKSRNQLRETAYAMKVRAQNLLFHEQLPPLIQKRAYVLGWSAAAVDKLARRCNIDGFFDANGADLDSLGLGQLLESNRLLNELSQAATSSLIHGPAFLAVSAGVAGEPDALVLPRSAMESTALWSPRTRSLTAFLSVVSDDDMILHTTRSTVTIHRSAGVWQVLDRDDHGLGVQVDAMRYRARLGRPFGQSRISRTVLSLQEQAMHAMTRADVNGEFYSMPRYLLLGASPTDFKDSSGNSMGGFDSSWSSIWALGDSDVDEASLARGSMQQFTGQTPEPQNQHLRMLAQMFSGETGIPIGELGFIGDANPSSAEALAAGKEDLITEAEQAMSDWSADIGSAVAKALAIQNGDPGLVDRLDVRPVWRSPVHTSRAAAADAGAKTIAALPWLGETEVGLEMLGLSKSQIVRALEEKRRMQGRGILDGLAAAAGRDGSSDT